MALVAAPEIAAGVAELVLMGGASHGRGNMSPAAEFNIFRRSAAASVVFEQRSPDHDGSARRHRRSPAAPRRIAPIRALGTALAPPPPSCSAPASPRQAADGDATTLASSPISLAPELFRWREVNVAIETESRSRFGMTLIDWRGRSGRKAQCPGHRSR